MLYLCVINVCFFFFKQKTAYEMRISDWSSDVCSSDLDARARVLAEVDHLGAGVGLLIVVGDGDGVELAHRVVALQDAARVLPGDRRAGLDLGPGDLRVAPAAGAALGDEVVDAALAVIVAGIPVLHRRVLDLGVVERARKSTRLNS